MPRKRNKLNKFVEITWHDACSSDAWCAKHELPELTVCVTRGWLVKKTVKEIVVAGSYYQPEDPVLGETISIPMGCVDSVKVLAVQEWKNMSLD